MRQYARKIDAALRDVLAGRDLPLIVAGAPPLEAIFRSVCSYPHLADEGIEGNPEGMADDELTDRARQVLDRVYAAQLRSAARTCRVPARPPRSCAIRPDRWSMLMCRLGSLDPGSSDSPDP